MGEDATMGEAKAVVTSAVSLDVVKVSLSSVLLFAAVFFVLCPLSPILSRSAFSFSPPAPLE